MTIGAFFRHARLPLRKEITVLIVLKLCFLVLLWYACFKHPLKASERQDGLNERFFRGESNLVK